MNTSNPTWVDVSPGTKLTSHIRGISKKTIFEAFLNNTEKFEKLQEFGRFPLSDGAVDAAERLLLNAAKSTQETLDNARGKAALSYMKKGDFSDLLLKLLPTSNAWLQHCQRANVMINIWGHALETTYVTPQLQNNGFILQDESLQVQWISIPTWPQNIAGLRVHVNVKERKQF
ncbi:unnamed protein product [Didymodactylos carnosus]|uniref:Uncharacterized protein n=1 Tax=Didymodactylos carnosus TaxID=1234261 RepID=A0A8S2UCT0_9BILA|nr:unnamed protein product [Didymodactylos carnosus]